MPARPGCSSAAGCDHRRGAHPGRLPERVSTDPDPERPAPMPEAAAPDPDAADPDAADEGEPLLARLVLESELLATGRAAPTAIHLALWGPSCAGQDAWTIARRCGWTDPELANLRVEGEQFFLVLEAPGARWGEARAEVLASLLLALRPDEARSRPAALFVDALRVPAGAANPDQREAQRSLTRVFGIRDPIYGNGQFPAADEPSSPDPLFLVAWFDRDAVNGLLPGSAAPLDEYAEPPRLVRLPWPEVAG